MPKKLILQNKMKIFLTESHKSPVVSFQVWVQTGSADEKNSEAGISHFIEHLVFKGSRQFKMGEIAQLIEGSGGELNAYTSFDQTVFYITISKHFTDVALTALSEMMGYPLFDEVEIENEKEVVIEEIKRGKDNLSRMASELLFKKAYSKHPYSIPIIGYEKNIKRFKREKILDFYNSRYSTGNMFLIVSGDFEIQEMKTKIKKYFGSIPLTPMKKIKRTREIPQKKPRFDMQISPFSQSIAYFGWKIPPINHPDVPALDLLALILGQGDSSRLVKKLRIESPLVNAIGSSLFSPKEKGLFLIYLVYNQENIIPALSKLSEELKRLLEEPILNEEIVKSVINIESDEFYNNETVEGLSRKVGSLEFYFKDQKYLSTYLKKLRSLTAEDLQKVAKKYLTSKRLTVAVTTGKKHYQREKNLFQKWLQNWEKNQKANTVRTQNPFSFDKSNIKKSKQGKLHHHRLPQICWDESFVETKKIILPNGISLLLRPSKGSPLTIAKVVLMGGLRIEKPHLSGMTEFFSRTWTGGTSQRMENQIYKETEELAASLNASSGKNSVSLTAHFLSPFEKKIGNLFMDVLTGSLFPNDVIEREKFIQIEHIRSREDNPSQICIQKFYESIFKEHPYSYDQLGKKEDVLKIDQEQLLLYWREMLTRKNMTFILSGHFDQSYWEDQILSQTESLPLGERLLREIPTQSLTKDVLSHHVLKKEQTHIAYGFFGPSMMDEDRYVVQIIQAILAGQGGRLFLELRDKNSLAYTVSPLRFEGYETGSMGAYIACSPHKAEKAIELMKKQFELLMDHFVQEEELIRAKRFLIGRHDIDLQRMSSITSEVIYNDVYGLDYNEVFLMSQKIEGIKKEDIRRVAQKIYSQRSVTSIVGH